MTEFLITHLLYRAHSYIFQEERLHNLLNCYMSLHMETQMIRARESSLTEPALEGSVARVFPAVPRQLIRPRELPTATFPITHIRLFSCMSPQVGLQMRRFRVCFATSWCLTCMGCNFLTSPGFFHRSIFGIFIRGRRWHWWSFF